VNRNASKRCKARAHALPVFAYRSRLYSSPVLAATHFGSSAHWLTAVHAQSYPAKPIRRDRAVPARGAHRSARGVIAQKHDRCWASSDRRKSRRRGGTIGSNSPRGPRPTATR